MKKLFVLFTFVFLISVHAQEQARPGQQLKARLAQNVPQHSPGSHGPLQGGQHPVAPVAAQVVPEVAAPIAAAAVHEVAPVVAPAPVLAPHVIENVIPTPSPAPIIPSGAETSVNELAAVQKKVQDLENALNVFKTETTGNINSIQQALNALKESSKASGGQNDKSELEKLKVQLVKIDQEINGMKKNFATAFSGLKK